MVDNYGFNAATYGYYDDDSNAFSILGNNFSGATGEGAIYLGGYETNVVIQDNQATVSEDGLYMYYVEGGQVDGNDFSGALDYALYLYYVTDVRFDPDNISSSGGEGVYLYESDEVSFVGTIALNEVEEAFDIENSVDVSVVNSVGSSATNDGMYLYEDADVFLSNDNVSNSDIGLYLSSNGNVTVVGCTLYADTNIFELAGGGANLLYHNNFIDVTGDLGWVNQNQPGSMFTWDDGYAVGGNYWNNHTSPDIERGPGQNIPAPSGDGIVDTPVVINATNIDHYPLTTPWKSPTITFLETGLPVGTPWTVVVNGTTVTSTTAAAVYAQANGAYSQYRLLRVARRGIQRHAEQWHFRPDPLEPGDHDHLHHRQLLRHLQRGGPRHRDRLDRDAGNEHVHLDDVESRLLGPQRELPVHRPLRAQLRALGRFWDRGRR